MPVQSDGHPSLKKNFLDAGAKRRPSQKYFKRIFLMPTNKVKSAIPKKFSEKLPYHSPNTFTALLEVISATSCKEIFLISANFFATSIIKAGSFFLPR